MRIYVTGNEDTARYHLPVVQARAMDFAERCKCAGLSQDAMAFSFEDTGTRVSVQYVFGQIQVQIASPVIDSIPIAKEKEDNQVVMPGTFYMETSLGYFWVRVRKDDEGISRVELEAFEAMKSSDDISSQEFVYPAMGYRTPGMLSGSFGSDDNRYVASQAGGIFVGKDQQKGTIKMPPTGNEDARLNVQQNDAGRGEFCIIDNTEGKSCFFKYIVVSLDDNSEVSVEMKHGNVDMLSEGETGGIIPDNLEKIPCWIHRKCLGSYFSPNKTIGYHVDVGTDDDYFGNAWAIPSGIQDKLDNGTGEFSYFNHVMELYRIAPLAAAPLSVDDQFISLLLVSPTMIWDAPTRDEMCWGGYGNTTFGCLDQPVDFQRSILAPRFCVAKYSFASGGVVSVIEPLYASIHIKSWCSFFGASLSSLAIKQCSSKPLVSDFETKEADNPCGWSDEGTAFCMSGQIAVDQVVPKEQRYMQHGIYGFEEDLIVHREIEFSFNVNSYIASPDSRGKNFYFLFDGLWHESMAAMWLTNPVVSNQCGLCAEPAWAQMPGGNVTFVVNGSIQEGTTIQWLAENATEYVNNLQIIAPLAVRDVYLGMTTSSQLCFIAKVPEMFAAPHEPVVLVGGITYPSPDVEGETISCEYTLMSAPCICDGGFHFYLYGFGSYLAMTGGRACIQGGCGPYNWSVIGGSLYDDDGNYGPTVNQTDKTYFQIAVSDYSCSARLSVTDACGETIELEAEDSGGARPIYGPTFLQQGASATYHHGMGTSAVYSGGLTVISEGDNSAVLQMPSTQTEPVTIGWSGPCGWAGSLTVTPGYCHCEDAGSIAWACYSSWCSWLSTSGGKLGVVGGCGPLTWTISGGSFVVGGVDVGSSIIATSTRYVDVVVDAPNCEVSVSVTDDTCLTTITKEASRDGGGSLTGPEVLSWGNSAWYYHNIANAVYSGGLVLVQQTGNALRLKMPEETTSVQTISVSGACNMYAELEVAPSYCMCQDSPMSWGQYSQDIALNGTAHMYFSGGCAPFNWYGSNVDFVDGAGSVIPFSARKSMSGLYVRSTDECEGSMTVTDRCGQSLSRSKSIFGTTGTVVGPSTLVPGETGAFYHDLGSSATYDGTLEMVQQSGNGAILRMPAGASGSYTASWSGSCGRSASMSVSGNVCAVGLPRTGYGDPRGLSVDLTGFRTKCGTVTSTVVYSFFGGGGTGYWEVGGGGGWGVPWICMWASASGTFYYLLVEEWT